MEMILVVCFSPPPPTNVGQSFAFPAEFGALIFASLRSEL